jgi:hypothetical protein
VRFLVLGIDRRELQDYIVNCSTFQSRTTSDLEKSILVLQALFVVAFGNSEWNGLGHLQLLI